MHRGERVPPEVPLHVGVQQRFQLRLDLGGGGLCVPVEPTLPKLPQDGVDGGSKQGGVEFLGVVVLVAQPQDGLEIKQPGRFQVGAETRGPEDAKRPHQLSLGQRRLESRAAGRGGRARFRHAGERHQPGGQRFVFVPGN